jgi:hypothetical protein
MSLHGIHGRPFLDLSGVLPVPDRGAMHEEVCLALSGFSPRYTGGSHRSMGIMPVPDSRGDYGEVIASLSDAQYLMFASLADPEHLVEPRDRHQKTWGEDREVPLSTRQMRWLELRHDVYFPWKVYLELMPNDSWATKSDPRGKSFTREARLRFPQTVRFVQSLPFAHIGSVKLLGLLSGDDGTIHRDAEPTPGRVPDEFISFSPGTHAKRLFVYDPQTTERIHAPSWAYWFNDADYHGVEADPGFRYSIRVDGVFDDAFRDEVLP